MWLTCTIRMKRESRPIPTRFNRRIVILGGLMLRGPAEGSGRDTPERAKRAIQQRFSEADRTWAAEVRAAGPFYFSRGVEGGLKGASRGRKESAVSGGGAQHHTNNSLLLAAVAPSTHTSTRCC